MSVEWKISVKQCSFGLDNTSYCHSVINGHREIIVAFTTHVNYDRIHIEDIDNGLVRRKGIGRREPDLTPHPDAVIIFNALNTP